MYYIVKIFHHLLLLVKFLTLQFLLCTNDFIEAIAIFTALMKLCSPMAKYMFVCNAKVQGIAKLGKIYLNTGRFSFGGVAKV